MSKEYIMEILSPDKRHNKYQKSSNQIMSFYATVHQKSWKNICDDVKNNP